MRLVYMFLALIALAAPAKAELHLALSFHGGTGKQEMQGGPGAHFSLTGPESGYSLALGFSADRTGPSPRLGLQYAHSDQGRLDSADSPRRWHRQLQRRTRNRTDSLIVTATWPLIEQQDRALSLRGGLGVARSDIRIADHGETGHATGVVPRAELALRQSLRSMGGTEYWSELGYHSSPALTVSMSDGRHIRHELSGFTLSLGVTISLDR